MRDDLTTVNIFIAVEVTFANQIDESGHGFTRVYRIQQNAFIPGQELDSFYHRRRRQRIARSDIFAETQNSLSGDLGGNAEGFIPREHLIPREPIKPQDRAGGLSDCGGAAGRWQHRLVGARGRAARPLRGRTGPFATSSRGSASMESRSTPISRSRWSGRRLS